MPATIAETHISVLVSIGDRVYKLKKSVSFGFLDFSDRPRRERACHPEVELNRRLAPDVYLRVADVNGADGEPMPADRRLATLVRDGLLVDEPLRDVARRPVTFGPTGAPPSYRTIGRQRRNEALVQGGHDQYVDRRKRGHSSRLNDRRSRPAD